MYWEILFNLGEMGRLFTVGAIFVIYFSMPVYDLQIQRFVSFLNILQKSFVILTNGIICTR